MTKHTPQPSPSIRAASLAHFEAVADGLGLDSTALLVREGLDPAALQDPDAKLPAIAVAALLEAAAAESGRADFGLLLAQAWSIADLGPVSLAVAHQDTLREALDTLSVHRLHLSDAIFLHLQADITGAELRIVLELPADAASAQARRTSPSARRSRCAAPSWAQAGYPWAPALRAARRRT